MELDIHDFITKIKAMRESQKSWYRYKQPQELKKAMRLEQQVDTILNNFKTMLRTPALQKGLFVDDEVRF